MCVHTNIRTAHLPLVHTNQSASSLWARVINITYIQTCLKRRIDKQTDLQTRKINIAVTAVSPFVELERLVASLVASLVNVWSTHDSNETEAHVSFLQHWGFVMASSFVPLNRHICSTIVQGFFCNWMATALSSTKEWCGLQIQRWSPIREEIQRSYFRPSSDRSFTAWCTLSGEFAGLKSI